MTGLHPAAAASQASSAGEKLSPASLDALGRAVLLLARELWVTRDRLMVAEALLAERGIALGIDAHQPDAALAEQLAAERARLTAAIMETLAGR